MLLTSGALPSSDAWTFEVKWDGCRAHLRYDGRSVSLRTRNGRECASDFPELAEIAARSASVGGHTTVKSSASGQTVSRPSASSVTASPVQLREDARRCCKRSISHTSTATRRALPPMRSGDPCSRNSRSTAFGRLEGLLGELPARRHGPVAWYPVEVSVLAPLHGLPDGPVRDAVLREVLDA